MLLLWSSTRGVGRCSQHDRGRQKIRSEVLFSEVRGGEADARRRKREEIRWKVRMIEDADAKKKK